ERLADENAFDLAWLPSFFIAEDVLPRATARACASLRPGGFIVLPTGSNPAADDQHQAVSALVNDLWGGPSLTVAQGESLLRDAGIRDVRTVPGPAWAPAILVGQRSPQS